MATPNVRATGFSSYGDRGPDNSASGVLGREFGEEGAMMLEVYARQNIYDALSSSQYGMVIPGNGGTEIAQWWRYPLLSKAEPLTEGVPPNATELSRQRVTKNLVQLGKVVQMTDLLRGRSIHSLPNIALQRLMTVFMETNDEYARDSLFLTDTPSSGNFPTTAQGGNVGGAHDRGNKIESGQVRYAGGKTAYTGLNTASNGADFTLEDIRALSESLEMANVPMLTPRSVASDRVDTHPGDPCYIGVVDSVGRRILEGLTTGTGALEKWKFEFTKNYSQPTDILPNELGRTGNVKWLWSTSPAWAGTGVAGGTGRRLAILGADAFSTVQISNEMLNIYASPEGASKSDPLNQVYNIGIKWSIGYTILTPAHMRVLFYTTAS